MIQKLYNSINHRLQNKICERKDFRTSRHIIVFESDDWGSIRMSNKKNWDELLQLGYPVDKRPYERFDTLESVEDLEALFEVLSKHKDCKGNHPVITANMLMANPDFEHIKESGYQEYYYEPIETTYERYFGNAKVLELMRQGYECGIFMPQSHGREHFNVTQWLKGLRDGNEDLLTAFKYGMCGIAPKAHPEKGNQLMNALRATNEQEQKQIDKIVVEGLQMFEQMWGFKSKTFVAPCYCWNEEVEKILARNGVRLIQTSRYKKAAYNSPAQCKYSGENNTYNQYYSIRNCIFEPSTTDNTTNESLMKKVDMVFEQGKIAVFSTHRINYVGGLSEQNRKNTLLLLDGFIKILLNVYPDLEFVNSEKILSYYEH